MGLCSQTIRQPIRVSCGTFDRKHAVTSNGATERNANGLQVGHRRRELLSSIELITTLPEYAEPLIWSEWHPQFMLALRKFDVALSEQGASPACGPTGLSRMWTKAIRSP